MNDISLKEARRLVLSSQGLLASKGFGNGKRAVETAVEALGYVQIDTISVVDRAHHHVLKERIPNYSEDMLDQLQSVDRKVFEYWAHAAAYLPMKNYRYYLPMMSGWRNSINREGHRKPDKKLIKEIIRRVTVEGPLQSRDFEQAETTKLTGWWDWKPAKKALEFLFLSGELMITRREGFQKVYDLPERVLPEGADTGEPDHGEWFRFMVLSNLRSLGLGTARDIGYSRTAIRRFTGLTAQKYFNEAIENLCEEGSICPIQLAGETWFALPEQLDQSSRRIGKKHIKFLSPFDNLVINRDRTKTLFDFEYLIECYVPEPKRQYGYFCLPILYGDEIIGRMDAKADRKAGTLIVKNLVLEKDTKVDQLLIENMRQALISFMEKNKCEKLEIIRTEPVAFAKALSKK